MTLRAWPFLVTRTDTQDYRLVAVPGFVYGTPGEQELRKAALSTADEAGLAPTPTGTVVVRALPNAAATLFLRVIIATREAVDLGGSGPLTDQHGRPILLIEGIAVQGAGRDGTRIEGLSPDLDEAHDRVLPALRDFWTQAREFTRHRSDATALGGDAAGLVLRVMAPQEGSRPVPPRPARRRRGRRAATWAVGAAGAATAAVISLWAWWPEPEPHPHPHSAAQTMHQVCQALRHPDAKVIHTFAAPAFQRTTNSAAFLKRLLGTAPAATACSYRPSSPTTGILIVDGSPGTLVTLAEQPTGTWKITKISPAHGR